MAEPTFTKSRRAAGYACPVIHLDRYADGSFAVTDERTHGGILGRSLYSGADRERAERAYSTGQREALPW